MVAIDIDFEDEVLPKGCVSDVASKIDTGYEVEACILTRDSKETKG